MRRKYGRLAVLCTALILILCPAVDAVPEQTGAYETYTYSHEDGRELLSAAAYVPVQVITGAGIGVGGFSGLSDIFVDESREEIYLVDAGNNRVIRTRLDWSEPRVFTGATAGAEEEMFSSPQGIFVDDAGCLYIADTGNKRVVKLDREGNLLASYGKPDSPQFQQWVEYKPLKVAVDGQGILNIVCEGVYEGLVTLDQQGEFQGYSGMNLVKPTLWDLFWRLISTRQQLQSMQAFIPITYNNVDLDEQDFLYAVSQTEGNGSASAVQRLNPGGNDVLDNRSGQPLVGDRGNMTAGRAAGASQFTDICYMGGGLFACADSRRSKIFVYSDDGELLFAFGNPGSQTGQITVPSAIDSWGYTLYAADSSAGQVTVYRTTAYGKCLLDGLASYKMGDYEASCASFTEAFRYNTSSEVVYLGIGKAQLRQGDYQDAMASFRRASSRLYYSKAFKAYRQELLDANFPLIFGAAALLILFLVFRLPLRRLLSRRRKIPVAGEKKGRADSWLRSVDFSLYCAVHPFKGFYELKHEKRGSLGGAFTILAVFITVTMFSASMKGFLFGGVSAANVRPLQEAAKVFLPLLLFVVANWCVTTLMNGEGRMRDILIAACYALMPLLLGQVLLTAASNVLTSEEAALYYAVSGFLYLWTGFLLLAGNMSAHGFTMGRTVLTALVTLVAMAVIVFLLFLFFNLAFEVAGYIEEIYRELAFRI